MGRGLGHARMPTARRLSLLRSAGVLPVGLGLATCRRGWELGFPVKSLSVFKSSWLELSPVHLYADLFHEVRTVLKMCFLIIMIFLNNVFFNLLLENSI